MVIKKSHLDDLTVFNPYFESPCTHTHTRSISKFRQIQLIYYPYTSPRESRGWPIFNALGILSKALRPSKDK